MMNCSTSTTALSDIGVENRDQKLQLNQGMIWQGIFCINNALTEDVLLPTPLGNLSSQLERCYRPPSRYL